MCKQISLTGPAHISRCVTHSQWHEDVVVFRSGAGLPCSSGIALHFSGRSFIFIAKQWSVFVWLENTTTINLAAAELTGQKPMQPLLGTEHYQCMDSLFIRGSIRHRSLHCHTETDARRVNAAPCTTLPTVEKHRWKNLTHKARQVYSQKSY